MKIKTKHLALSLTVAGLIVSASVGGTMLNASAAGTDLNLGGLGGRLWLDGVTQADAEAAYTAEWARIKEEFPDARLYADPINNPWPDSSNSWHCVDFNAMAHMENVGTWNMWNHSGVGFICFNPNNKTAYTIHSGSAVVFSNMNNGWANQANHTGYPKDNAFTVTLNEEDVVCQNFALGYVAGTTFNYGKQMSADGVESDLTVEDIANNLTLPWWDQAGNEGTFAGLKIPELRAAYETYYEGKEINTAPMWAWSTSHMKNSVWRQDVVEDGEKVGQVVYNSKTKKMYTVKSFLSNYNSTTAWGNPVGEEQTTGGVVNQLFDYGVVYIDAADENKVKYAEASHIDENGNVVSDYEGDLTGVVVKATAEQFPDGVTADAVKTAVKAVYTEALGAAARPMEFLEGFDGEILAQDFTVTEGNETKTSRIYLDITKGTLTAAVLENEAYELYKEPARFNEGNKRYPVTGEMILGPATSSKFTAGGKTYQNFLYGAMELSAAKEADTVLPGVNYDESGKRTVLDLSEFIKIGDVCRIPDSYNIGAADLLAAFKAAYKEYAKAGIAVGMPNKEGIGSWYPDPGAGGGQDADTNEFNDGRGMIKLGLHMTDSSAICYYGVTAYMAYSPKDGKVYIMKDAVISNIATYYCVYGAPISDLIETTITTEDGDEVTVQIQNFELGYLTVMGGSASMTADRHWDFTLKGAVNLDGSKIPGTVYPGENEGNPDTDPEKPEEPKKGCGGVMSVTGGVLGIALLAGVVTLVTKLKKKN